MPVKRKPSYPVAQRLVKIFVMIMTRKPVRAGDLAQELSVNERTIFRDVQKLRMLYDAESFPYNIEYDEVNRTYRVGNLEGRALRFYDDELISLIVGEKLVTGFKGTPYEAAIKSALKNIRASLPEEKAEALVGIEEYFCLDFLQGKDYSLRHNDFQKLLSAMVKRQSVKIQYYNATKNEHTHRVIDPYGFVHSRGTWYVRAYDHLRKERRTFGMENILGIQRTDDAFDRPKNYKLEEDMGKGWRIFDDKMVNVKAKFVKRAARVILNQQFHPSQKEVERHPDGSVTFSYEVAGTREIKRWILSFGSMVEVLEPTKLRKQVQVELSQAMGVYVKER